MIGTLIRKYHAGVRYLLYGPEALKASHELRVWHDRAAGGKELSLDSFYRDLFTSDFGLDVSYYLGKNMLDIGCGPRGSLEWADMASVRIGLDPLAHDYHKLWTRGHKMQYVTAAAENIPFPDQYFDVVSSFRSLKHIIGIDRAVDEIIRVIAPGGIFLLCTSINSHTNHRQPTIISWAIVERFISNLHPVQGTFTEMNSKTQIPIEEYIAQSGSRAPQLAGHLVAIMEKR